MRLFRSPSLLLLLLLLLPSGGSAQTAENAAPIHTLKDGWMVMAEGAVPPAFPGAGWQRVELPDNWSRSHPDQGGKSWYHFALNLAQAPEGLWAVYLPRVNMNAAVVINGHFIGSGGSFDEPVTRNWNRPLYFSFSSTLLKQGANRIDVRIVGYANDGAGINPFSVGPADLLRADYQRQFDLHITTSIIVFFMTLGLSILVFALWLLRRHETVYLMFSISMLMATIIAAHTFLLEIPVPLILWTWIWHSAAGGYVCVIALFMHRFVGVKRAKIEQAVLAYTVLGSLLIGLAGTQNMAFNFLLWEIGFAVLSIYVLGMLFFHRKQGRRGEVWSVLIALFISASYGYYDLSRLLFSAQHIGPFIYHLGPMVLGISIAWLLMLRFVRSMREQEMLNAQLHTRVDEKSHELEDSNRHLAQLEKEQAISAERERIMRELHDGLGAYLVSALAYSEKEDMPMQPLHKTIRSALNDLRLMIDSMENEPGNTADMLGTIRERLEAAVSLHGGNLHWRIDDEPVLPKTDASSQLHVMRIVQEAFTNIAKHSGATDIYFHADKDFLEISDNGRGFDTSRQHSGHGIRNMRARAHDIGLQMDIESLPKGTVIRLFW